MPDGGTRSPAGKFTRHSARRWVSPTSRVTRGGGFRLRGNESDTKVAVVQPGRQGPRLFGYRGQWLFMTGPEDGLPGRSLGEP